MALETDDAKVTVEAFLIVVKRYQYVTVEGLDDDQIAALIRFNGQRVKLTIEAVDTACAATG